MTTRSRFDPPVAFSDGVVFRVLQNLLILDGERLSYRTLDVEQIGSVYETMMGFNLEVAQGRSIAIKPTKPHGAPTTINLDELLAAKPADRAKWLKEQTGQTVTGQAANALKDAKTPEGIVAALDRKVAHEATPNIVPPGAMVLQPSEERRKSGSHYTPRSLTEPIVRTTLRPILERLGVGRSDLGSGGDCPPPSSQLPVPLEAESRPGGQKGDDRGRIDQLVSRSQGLATGDGSGGGLLRSDAAVSARGDVRPDEPDPESRGRDPANMAEGHGRGSRKEYRQFLRVAQASLRELETHLMLSARVSLLSSPASDKLLETADRLGRMLNTLQQRLRVPPPKEKGRGN